MYPRLGDSAQDYYDTYTGQPIPDSVFNIVPTVVQTQTSDPITGLPVAGLPVNPGNTMATMPDLVGVASSVPWWVWVGLAALAALGLKKGRGTRSY
jgi:hypothetical protein